MSESTQPISEEPTLLEIDDEQEAPIDGDVVILDSVKEKIMESEIFDRATAEQVKTFIDIYTWAVNSFENQKEILEALQGLVDSVIPVDENHDTQYATYHYEDDIETELRSGFSDARKAFKKLVDGLSREKPRQDAAVLGRELKKAEALLGDAVRSQTKISAHIVNGEDILTIKGSEPEEVKVAREALGRAQVELATANQQVTKLIANSQQVIRDFKADIAEIAEYEEKESIYKMLEKISELRIDSEGYAKRASDIISGVQSDTDRTLAGSAPVDLAGPTEPITSEEPLDLLVDSALPAEPEATESAPANDDPETQEPTALDAAQVAEMIAELDSDRLTEGDKTIDSIQIGTEVKINKAKNVTFCAKDDHIYVASIKGGATADWVKLTSIEPEVLEALKAGLVSAGGVFSKKTEIPVISDIKDRCITFALLHESGYKGTELQFLAKLENSEVDQIAEILDRTKNAEAIATFASQV